MSDLTIPPFPDAAASATPLPAWAMRPPSPFTPVQVTIVRPVIRKWWQRIFCAAESPAP